MSAPVLLDTGILVCAFDHSEPVKRDQAVALLDALQHEGIASVTTQVLEEFFVTAARRFKTTMNHRTAARHAPEFGEAFGVHENTLFVIRAAFAAAVRHKIHFYDAQIWAAAYVNRIPLVLSEDFTDGRVIDGVHFANPFLPQFDLAEALERAVPGS